MTMNPTNSFKLAEFEIVDGDGISPDADNVVTELTDISIELTNISNLSKVALFDGINLIEEKTAAELMTFNNGFSLIAPDDGTKQFSIRATFKNDSLDVFDKDEIHVTITSVTNGGGSKFKNPDGSTQTGNIPQSVPGKNRIDVIASQLLFSIPSNPREGINIPLVSEPEVRAVDANGVRDVDFIFGANITTSGASTNPVTKPFVNGILAFSGTQYTSTGDGQLTITSNALSVTGVNVDVINVSPTNLDIGGATPVTNNGIETNATITGGAIGKVLIGFNLSPATATTCPLRISISNPSCCTRWGTASGWRM
jgi:hypothetical protein